ncbi:MAG: hypothetical protein AAGA83_23190 [Cyanobacteria bacterium P01_F01_bin.116]
MKWTPFLPTDRPIQIQAGEALRSLIKYLPSSKWQSHQPSLQAEPGSELGVNP